VGAIDPAWECRYQAASTLFGLALLASGQQASITGTMAGQIVMEGMVRIRLRPWKRRLLTRFVALVPAVVITAVYPNGAANLLILSQVILSLTLSFCTPSRLKFDGGRW
jgi:manganese transport protein